MNKVKNIISGLFATALLAGCAGKADGSAAAGDACGMSLDRIEHAAAALYRENEGVPAEGAVHYGGGVFVSRTINGKKRFLIVSANHVALCLLYSRDFRAVQVGMDKKGEKDRILRATMPGSLVKWFEGDAYHDLIAVDITDSLQGLDALNADIQFVDLDVPYHAATGEKCVCIASAGAKSELASAELYLWTSPFARREGVVTKTGVDKKHEFAHSKGTGFRMMHRVDVTTIECVEGDSGSPVFSMPKDGLAQFCGIVIGAGAGMSNIVPAETIARYIDTSFGVNLSKEPLPEEALREVEAVTVRGSGDGEGVDMKTFRSWHPGIRRVVVEMAGVCTKTNAMEASVGVYYGDTGIVRGEDVYIKVGWDNESPNTGATKPGFKKTVLTFDLDETGRTIARNVKSDDFTIDCGGEPRKLDDMKYSRDWNMLKIKTSGGNSEDSYARVILYAAKE